MSYLLCKVFTSEMYFACPRRIEVHSSHHQLLIPPLVCRYEGFSETATPVRRLRTFLSFNLIYTRRISG